MDLEYILKAAESYERDGQKADAAGNTGTAMQYYAKAEKKYRQAAEMCPERRKEFLAKASRLGTAGKAASSAAPQVQPKREVYPQTKPAEEFAENENSVGADYSDYDLNIVKPNDELSFSDLIGMEEAKDTIHKNLIYPMQNPESFKKYKLDAGGFILLYGPPGTGKTFFAKVTASAVSVPFINVDCTALVDSLIGKTAKNIDELFSKVRKFIVEQNTPVIMFLDEIDSLAKSRSSGNKTAEEAVPSLLRQLDGLGANNANISIIAATNIMQQIDSAVLSRFNNKIYVPLPNAEARRALFVSGLKKHNVDKQDMDAIDFDTIASASDGLSGRDIAKITDEFVRGLAMRDSGITKQSESLTNTILSMIAKR